MEAVEVFQQKLNYWWKNKNFLTLLKGLYNQIFSICRPYFYLEMGL